MTWIHFLLRKKNHLEYYSKVSQSSSEGRQTVRTADRVEFEIFAKIMKKHRLKAKMTQWKLSELVGRSASYVGKFESGKVYPDFVTGLEMIRVLGLNPNEIISQIHAEARKRA